MTDARREALARYDEARAPFDAWLHDAARWVTAAEIIAFVASTESVARLLRASPPPNEGIPDRPLAQATAKLHVAVIFAVRGDGKHTTALVPARGLRGLLAAASKVTDSVADRLTEALNEYEAALGSARPSPAGTPEGEP